jgi:hypothetical protein
MLDRVQIWRVFWQEEKPRAGAADGQAHCVALVRAEIVHDHDVPRSQGGDKNSLDVKADDGDLSECRFAAQTGFFCDAVIASFNF